MKSVVLHRGTMVAGILITAALGVACTIFGSGSSCQAAPPFGAREDCGEIEQSRLTEISGMVASRKYPGLFWCHNDSGDDARVFVFDENGHHRAEFLLDGIPSRDWEDIAIGPGPKAGVDYLYIGDIGDNNASYKSIRLHRFPEPNIGSSTPASATVTDVETITLRYPDGARDAETLLVDPRNGNVYIVTKRDRQCRLYQAKAPLSDKSAITLDFVCNLPITGAVGGDISFDGSEILIKTYESIYYWNRGSSTIESSLLEKGALVPYQPEPQGESVTWTPTGDAYYTVSEEPRGIPAHLYRYRRQLTGSDKE